MKCEKEEGKERKSGEGEEKKGKINFEKRKKSGNKSKIQKLKELKR